MENIVEEIWKDIPGYENMYQVSNLGNVKSLGNGLDSLATANSSLTSLYKPIVVTYVCGLFIKLLYITSPVDPEINDGFSE